MTFIYIKITQVDRTPPHVPVPTIITVAEPVGWTWDYTSRQQITTQSQLIIYYLISLTGSLREANNDLKMQLRREKNEREKPAAVVKATEPAIELPEDLTKWSSAKKILPVLPNKFRTSSQLLGEESDDSHDTPTKKQGKRSHIGDPSEDKFEGLEDKKAHKEDHYKDK
ncbi:hypothetical protein AVEN_97057-1 [Araneus ventricosus]|uniref:Uncharacterized protein n=1 Tax=Araneus ventricosus TaxID=182803 RepID=A0A4Y2JGY8_ARAVE|nr:hypothetical protein AVEN_97057-1 [Araneus ventricosus]